MSLSYEAALNYLYGLINYEVKRPERYAPDVISLERPRQLMTALGNPQEQYPIVHVTGTKGKGSVSAMCASILQAAGLRVGFYSSPNLQDFRERFRVNNELIPSEKLAELVEQVRPVVDTIAGLTWFEVVTAIAFLYFAEAKVDIAVIEVGLGGRLDATNIVRKPVASVITSLSFDHMHLLGNTLAEIAFEKGGIIKTGVPVVSAPQHEEALLTLDHIAAERSAPLIVVGRDYQFTIQAGDMNGQHLTIHFPGQPEHHYWTPLIGAHQAINAAVALATIQQVRKAGFTVSQQAMDSGLRHVNWPGRLEVVRRAPWLVLDVAHNAESAARLRYALTEDFPPVSQRLLIFGAYTDKDVIGMFRELLPITDHLILMQPSNVRAFSTEQLRDLARQADYHGPIEMRTTAQDALAYAESLAQVSAMIYVTGSLSVVGEMRTVLGLSPARAVYLDAAEVQHYQSLS